MSSPAAARLDLDGNPVAPLTICMIGAGGFIGSHLCEKLMAETAHVVLAVDVYCDKIRHLVDPAPPHLAGRISFHRLNIKNDSRLEGLIKMADLEPEFYVLKEDESPCIFGPIMKQRWSYACAKQLIERLVFAEGAENGLEFTIVRPFNWIGPRMDFIPGVDGPSEGVPRVLACFSNNLLRREPLKLVDGGQSQRTFVYIKDAIEAVVLMIENPARANGHIFNVGNPNNEVTVRELAQLMTEVYANVSGEAPLDEPMIDMSSSQFYGEGYDDSDKRIPDMTIINKQLGWNPKTPLKDLLETTLTYQHKTYKEAVKRQMSQASASS
ncbi:unnamed protein product [Urochloa decumbens]|uniref:NAD-dependent epimerase/dehydratase domain-containing protein n=1 Tax=Urochloa decumbens TaxID=240449 RepID=A0ABC8ZD29_9POAL